MSFVLQFVCAASLLVTFFVQFQVAGPSPEECRDAVDRYNSAKSDVADAIATYARCVSGSDGHDDCSTEFESLRSQQDEFESTVSGYENEAAVAAFAPTAPAAEPVPSTKKNVPS